MEKNINLVATLNIVLSGLNLFAGLIVFGILSVIGSFAELQDASKVLYIVGTALLSFLVLMSLPGIIAGIGLYNRKEWARILTIIISVFNLFNVPLGTALGIYSLYVLTQPEVTEKFRSN